MSVNQKIESALNGITENIWPLCCPDEHSPDVYIVYNPEIEMPGYHADDTDMEWVQYMQIHLFVKGNYIGLRRKIRASLREADFTVTDIDTTYEKDTGYSHLCFGCYIEEEE